MIAHHVKEIHNRESENFSIRSSFIYVIAIIAVIVASIFIVMTMIRGIYDTQPRTSFITISVTEIPIDKTYHIFVEPIKDIIIDSKQDKNNNFFVPVLQKIIFEKTNPKIKTLEDFNKKFYEKLMIWSGSNYTLQNQKFIFEYQEGIYFSSDLFFKKNSHILTADGEEFLNVIVDILKNLNTQLHKDLKWGIQVSGFLNSLSLKAETPILRDIAFMRYLQKYMEAEKEIALYISSQKTKECVKKNLCENIIGLKIIPAQTATAHY